MTEDGRWHLDKRVPISIIFTLFVQFFGGVWFLSRLESRVVALESAQLSQAERDRRQDASQAESMNLLRGDMREISRQLNRLIEVHIDPRLPARREP